MKILLFILVSAVLAFSACDNSSTTRTGNGTTPPPNTPAGSGPTDSPTATDDVVSSPTKPGDFNQLTGHQYCMQYVLNSKSYLNILNFQPDNILAVSDVLMSDTNIVNTASGSWKLQGDYLTLSSEMTGNVVQKIVFGSCNGVSSCFSIVLNGHRHVYTLCD